MVSFLVMITLPEAVMVGPRLKTDGESNHYPWELGRVGKGMTGIPVRIPKDISMGNTKQWSHWEFESGSPPLSPQDNSFLSSTDMERHGQQFFRGSANWWREPHSSPWIHVGSS